MRVLLVDDEQLALDRLKTFFGDIEGAEVVGTAGDGNEALERIKELTPDLVIMDIQMPHISGLELIERLKADEELKAIPIMAVTAYAAKGDEERIREAGAEGYVSKPISVLRFVEAVAALLAPVPTPA